MLKHSGKEQNNNSSGPAVKKMKVWKSQRCQPPLESFFVPVVMARLERRKYMNRGATQPEPFVFNTPTRSQSRQPVMPKATCSCGMLNSGPFNMSIIQNTLRIRI